MAWRWADRALCHTSFSHDVEGNKLDRCVRVASHSHQLSWAHFAMVGTPLRHCSSSYTLRCPILGRISEVVPSIFIIWDLLQSSCGKFPSRCAQTISFMERGRCFVETTLGAQSCGPGLRLALFWNWLLRWLLQYSLHSHSPLWFSPNYCARQLDCLYLGILKSKPVQDALLVHHSFHWHEYITLTNNMFCTPIESTLPTRLMFHRPL